MENLLGNGRIRGQILEDRFIRGQVGCIKIAQSVHIIQKFRRNWLTLNSDRRHPWLVQETATLAKKIALFLESHKTLSQRSRLSGLISEQSLKKG